MFTTIPYQIINKQVHVQAGVMVNLVELYLQHKKNVKVNITPLRDQEDIRKLGIAFDTTCKYFGIDNPFYSGGAADSWFKDFFEGGSRSGKTNKTKEWEWKKDDDGNFL